MEWYQFCNWECKFRFERKERHSFCFLTKYHAIVLQIVVPGVTSELGCLQACTNQNQVNGQFQGFVWRIPTRICSCKANAFTTSQNAQVDAAYMGLLVGTCSMYARSSK